MNTYNSFNELAAGQQTLASDMSVFNSSWGTTERAAEADKQLAKAQKFLDEVPLGSESDSPYKWTDDFSEVYNRLLEMRKKLQDA